MGFYLLGVIPEAEERTYPDIKLAGKTCKVTSVPVKDMSVICAKAPVQVYVPSRENAKGHQKGVQEIMKYHSVIPVSFGNVVESEKDVKKFLSQLRPEFQRVFPKIKNKMEVGLKLTASKEWLQEQAAGDKQLQKHAGKGNGHMYQQIEAGEASKAWVERFQKKFDQEVFRPLAAVADAAKSNEVVDPRMLLNAAFLLDYEKEETFDKKVNELYEEWGDHISFTYTGPWPAYNFIDIQVKASGS
ncbi:GvpL/GvpF family gas vesicle protein [Alkalicoccus chagannorensis]|uniref:GvpL/GvpF family gas vesicle protein n=1 Tax=Alkalicoccus chagannorensis TaxID=427072 RepID=UPI0004030217|nr:GvpL/GvpF family gas vesicle protein [Alkalicoccus chagannorensis]